jgi:hypothetical protein
MAFAVGGALILGGASLAGSAMSNRTNRKIAEQAQAQNAQDKALTQQYAKAAMEQLPVGYQNAQAVRQQALGQSLGLAGQTFQPTAEMINQGGMMNQNALLAGLQLQRNAILGKDMDYSTLQAMSPQMDYAALSGLMNPQGLDFKAIEPIKNTFTTTQADIQSYLDENKDIEEDYKRQLPELRAGDPNNPNYKDIQSYGRWHYDNIGKYEIEQGKRTWSGQPVTTKAAPQAQAAQLVTTDQVSKILNAGMRP